MRLPTTYYHWRCWKSCGTRGWSKLDRHFVEDRRTKTPALRVIQSRPALSRCTCTSPMEYRWYGQKLDQFLGSLLNRYVGASLSHHCREYWPSHMCQPRNCTCLKCYVSKLHVYTCIGLYGLLQLASFFFFFFFTEIDQFCVASSSPCFIVLHAMESILIVFLWKYFFAGIISKSFSQPFTLFNWDSNKTSRWRLTSRNYLNNYSLPLFKNTRLPNDCQQICDPPYQKEPQVMFATCNIW